MLEQRTSPVDLTRPRSVGRVIVTALTLFVRYPLLFTVLALAVVTPYELIVLAATKAGPLGQSTLTASAVLVLSLIDAVIVGPLIASFFVQVLVSIADGEQPLIGTVVARGLRVVLVVIAAQIVALIGIAIGLLALVLPGILLAICLAVVAQVAAVERTDWPGALRRSATLTRGNYLRVFALLVCVGLTEYGIAAGGTALAGSGAGAAPVMIGIAVETITKSIGALTTSVLYFDLRARQELSAVGRQAS